MPKTPRRPTDPMAAAEAAFKPAKKPAPPPISANSRLPPAKELVSIRIDRDILDHFQEDGPGWQDRINAALRGAAGMAGPVDEGKRPEELNATNDD